MKLNDNAVGVIIKGSNFEYVKAVRKPNSDCKISQEVWFIGKAKHFQKKDKEDNLKVVKEK